MQHHLHSVAFPLPSDGATTRRLPTLRLVTASLCAALLLAPTPLPAQDTAAKPTLEQRLRGTWSAAKSGQLLHFAGDRCVVASGLKQTLMRVRYDDDAGAIARNLLGAPQQVITSPLTFEDDNHATLTGKDTTLVLTRIAGPGDERPEAVRTATMAFGQREIDDAEIEAIQAELATRREREQDVRREMSTVQKRVTARYAEEGKQEPPFGSPEVQAVLTRMRKIDDANTRYIKDLMADVGWIDARRFGDDANRSAFLIVQHCGNIAMLRAVVAAMKAEFDSGLEASGSRYALMYDRLTLALGGEQRYGSQLMGRPDGSLHFPRLEEPAQVDARRRSVGLGSLSDYAKRFGSGKVALPAGYVPEER